MKQSITNKIDELRELLRAEMPEITTRVEIVFTAQSCNIQITDRTAEELKRDGISMRNLKGDFIS